MLCHLPFLPQDVFGYSGIQRAGSAVGSLSGYGNMASSNDLVVELYQELEKEQAKTEKLMEEKNLLQVLELCLMICPDDMP